MTSKDSSTLPLSLLNLAHPLETATQIYTEKIQHRPLHLKPNPQSTAQTTRRQARESRKEASRKKQKPRPLSARQKRALSLYDLPTSDEGLRYETYLPLHDLWTSYIQGLLNLSPTKRSCTPSEAAKLCSADFHGAVLEVVRSRCVGRVGIKGVVVKDLMGVFEVVCQGKERKGEGKRRDRKVVLPKEGTVFRFTVALPERAVEVMGDGEGDVVMENTMTNAEDANSEAELAKGKERLKELVFELHGDQFIYRAADRANRKFKPHFLRNI